MKNNAHFSLLLFIIIPFLLGAQADNSLMLNSCFSDQLHQKMLNENPYYISKHQTIEKKIYNSKTQSPISSTETTTTKTIPVVVHIVHANGPGNISDNQVFDAIQHLNEAFENIGHYDPNTGVNTEIDFCLAIRDPQNNPSIGINRILSPLTNLTVETQDDDLKALLQWDPFDYLNIWVVNEITSSSFGSGVAGYSSFPAAHGLPDDGIVIEANYFGSSENNSKVLVHEAGHYLGLYHTFQGGCTNNDCRINGDRVCDTPPDQSTAPVSCGASINTCSTDEDDISANNPFRPIALGGLGDQDDMYINYMDYGYLLCYSAFTEGQKVRMQNTISTTRQSLLTSYGCQAPCPFDSFEASFSTSMPSPVYVGELITFINNSNAANFYEWSIDNQVFSNDLNSSYIFDQEGSYTVTLFIQDTINLCKSTVEQTIEVVCEGEASFTTVSTEMINGETIMSFENTSTNHISYEWYLDGSFYSSDKDLTITFTDPGLYTLYLVGATSSCLNYSTTITINVASCTTQDKSEMHWYFGENAALDFNGGNPVFVPSSQTNSFEGTSCISDENGALLFYTDGLKIWDATNNVMPNGDGLKGGFLTSAHNNALVIPRPFHPDQYYVFTCDEHENSYEKGINYSIVDMTLNGGLGDVTVVKNRFLCPTKNNELMNAAYHADGEKVWFVVKSDYAVLSTYLIDSTGVRLPIHYSDDNNDTWLGHGIFFNSGKRMIFTRYTNNYPHFVIFDFDNATGIFSNPKEFLANNNKHKYTGSFELSQDDSKLYVIRREDDTDYGLYQFDLSLTTPNQIANSKTFIQQMATNKKLLLAPNSKIYHTNYNRQYLGVINYPNEPGIDCGHVANALDISPGNNSLSLPKFVRGRLFSVGIDDPMIDLGPDQKICDGLTTVLNPEGSEDYDYLWQDGSTDASYTAWLPGTYSVTVTNECGSAIDLINIESKEIYLVDLGDDIVNTSGSVTLDAGTFGDFYLWQDGSTNSTLTATEPGEYSVTVSTEEGCYQSDSIYVHIVIDRDPSSLILYPNPSLGLFTLEDLNENALYDIELTAFDALGRKVYEQSALLEGKVDIDLTQYPAGIYYLHWSIHKNSGVFKLIVVR